VLSPGPWLVLLAGAVQFFAGYFFIWASVVGLIDRPPVAAMCLFMWVAAHAQTFFNTTNVVSGVHNFSDYSGTIVGIMKVCADVLVVGCFQNFDLWFVLYAERERGRERERERVCVCPNQS